MHEKPFEKTKQKQKRLFLYCWNFQMDSGIQNENIQPANVQQTFKYKSLFISSDFVLFQIIQNDGALCENSEGFQLLTIFIKSSILDILLGFEYTSKQQALLGSLLFKIYLVCATA